MCYLNKLSSCWWFFQTMRRELNGILLKNCYLGRCYDGTTMSNAFHAPNNHKGLCNRSTNKQFLNQYTYHAGQAWFAENQIRILQRRQWLNTIELWSHHKGKGLICESSPMRKTSQSRTLMNKSDLFMPSEVFVQFSWLCTQAAIVIPPGCGVLEWYNTGTYKYKNEIRSLWNSKQCIEVETRCRMHWTETR